MSKEQKQKREKIISLYLQSIFQFISGGKYIMGEEISSIGLKAISDRILTRGKVTKVWNISGFPYNFTPELCQFLRNEMRLRYPSVNLSFQLINQPLQINVNNDLFTKQMRAASQRYEKFNSYFNSLSESDKALGVSQRLSAGVVLSFTQEDVLSKKQVVDSYHTVTSKVNNGSAINYCHIFVHCTAPSNKIMNQFATAFRLKLQSLKVLFKPVNSLLNTYLEVFGPSSFMPFDSGGYGQVFLPDDNIVHILPTETEGLINTEGFLMGVNIKNGSPLFLEFFKSGQGQTVMLCAKTGWGKTHTAFQMALGLLGDDCHVSVVDLKGGEWNKLGEYTKYIEINLGGLEPRCVNTLRLDDMILSKVDCLEAYYNAVEGTVRILSLMTNLGVNEGNPVDLNSILEKAVTTLYNQAGVVPSNPDTFKVTRNLKYEDVLPYIGELESNASNPKEVSEICKKARFRCEDYLKTGGRFSEAFKNEITLDEVLQSPLVIYSLNKNTTSDLDVVETIKVFMAQYLSTKKHHYRKRAGEHSALFSEEVQRMKEASDIVQFLSSSVSGARSQNVMNVFLLNDLNRLDGPSFSAIKGNVSTAIVGSVSESDMSKLITEYGFSDMEANLNLIKKEPDKYKNCFAIHYNTGYQYGDALYKAHLPKRMNESLATRTIRV